MSVQYLLLSILFGTTINLVFRWFKVFHVDKFKAIIINYLACFILGFALQPEYDLIGIISMRWAQYSLGLGALFVAIFYAMAATTEKLSVSINAVSSKMSVIGPVLFAIVVMKESVSVLFWIGLALSLLSIYSITVKRNLFLPKKYFLLPVIVFLGSGIIDTSLKLMEHHYAQHVSFGVMTYTIFLGAFLSGSILYIVRYGFRISLRFKDVIGGVALGVPNYFSIYYLLLAIHGFQLKSAFVFGINNVSIVLLSSLLSVLVFKEHLSRMNKIGLVLAIVSIGIIAYVS